MKWSIALLWLLTSSLLCEFGELPLAYDEHSSLLTQDNNTSMLEDELPNKSADPDENEYEILSVYGDISGSYNIIYDENTTKEVSYVTEIYNSEGKNTGLLEDELPNESADPDENEYGILSVYGDVSGSYYIIDEENTTEEVPYVTEIKKYEDYNTSFLEDELQNESADPDENEYEILSVYGDISGSYYIIDEENATEEVTYVTEIKKFEDNNTSLLEDELHNESADSDENEYEILSVYGDISDSYYTIDEENATEEVPYVTEIKKFEDYNTSLLQDELQNELAEPGENEYEILSVYGNISGSYYIIDDESATEEVPYVTEIKKFEDYNTSLLEDELQTESADPDENEYEILSVYGDISGSYYIIDEENTTEEVPHMTEIKKFKDYNTSLLEDEHQNESADPDENEYEIVSVYGDISGSYYIIDEENTTEEVPYEVEIKKFENYNTSLLEDELQNESADPDENEYEIVSVYGDISGSYYITDEENTTEEVPYVVEIKNFKDNNTSLLEDELQNESADQDENEDEILSVYGHILPKRDIGDGFYIIDQESTTEEVPYMTEFKKFECPSKFGFFPDPNGNCNVYYLCRNGTAERRTCKTGLHFNPVTKLCDFSARALCELKCPTVNGRFHVPAHCKMFVECENGVKHFHQCSNDQHFNAITKQCDHPKNAACEVTCPKYDTLVPLPGRCSMYASCVKGNATYLLCPSRLHFDPVLLRCDVPEDKDCKVKGPIHNVMNPSDMRAWGVGINKGTLCPASNGYFPVLGQCSTYIKCKNFFPRVFTCPSGLHFNFLLKSCDLPSKAGCELKCEKPNGFFPYPGVCIYYIKCINDVPLLKKCKEGSEYNIGLKQCDYLTKGRCMPHCPTVMGVYPVENHCDLYIRCSNGHALVKRCPLGLHFNALFKYCDIPARAKCEIECTVPFGMFPLPGRCNEYTVCENNKPTVHTCRGSLHYNARTYTCDWPISAKCELFCINPEGYFPVQGDCGAYVICKESYPILKNCPYGKHLDLHSKQCRYPDEATCGIKCPLKNGIIPLLGYCESYIYCKDGHPEVHTCSFGLLFNRMKNTCDLPENVECFL